MATYVRSHTRRISDIVAHDTPAEVDVLDVVIGVCENTSRQIPRNTVDQLVGQHEWRRSV